MSERPRRSRDEHRVMLRLSLELYADLAALAQQRDLPLATLARLLLRERVDQIKQEKPGPGTQARRP